MIDPGMRPPLLLGEQRMCYPSAIRAMGFKADSVSKEADDGKESPTKALPTTNISFEAAE